MLVLVLEFSRISATTLYPFDRLRREGASWSERPRRGVTQGALPLLQNGRRESGPTEQAPVTVRGRYRSINGFLPVVCHP